MADITGQDVVALFDRASVVLDTDEILMQSGSTSGSTALKVTAKVLAAYLASIGGIEATPHEFLTQAEYDALETKDKATLYLIPEE